MIEINNKKLCESCFAETEEEKCPHCGYSKEEYTADPMVLPLGTKLNDKIIVGKVMGKGGFGITYLGYDLRMEKTIAVKEYYPNGIAYRSQSGTEVLVADTKSNETFDKGTEKFYSEAEMVAQFNGNPNIVGVYDYFRTNNTVYLIMEYLNGITLKNYVKKHGKITDGQALFVMDKIAAALSITHSAGVLHRDISPDNIMVCLDGKIKLIDFGAARQIVAESSSNLTVVMKPGYTPIEQYTKKGRQGAWTDIYALGASIYFAMTETIIDDPYERMDNDDEFTENRHNINTTLWNVIKKCTMINATDRYGSAIELRKALSGVSAPVKPEPLPLDSGDMKAAEEEAAKEAAEASTNLIASTTGPIERFTEDEDESTEETAVPTEGYNPDVNVYAKTEKEKKPLNKKLLFGAIGGAAAVAAVVVGIVLFVNRPDSELPVDVNIDGTATTAGNASGNTGGGDSHTVTPAEWKQLFIDYDNDDLWASSNAISKETLQSFGSDVRITLGLRTVSNSDLIFHHTLFRHTVTPQSSSGHLEISADNGLCDDGQYDIYERHQNTFEFTVTKAEIDAMEGDLTFDPIRLEMYHAVIETFTGVGNVVKTVDFNEKYPGEWNRYETYISKSDLLSCGGDVRVEVKYDLLTANGDCQIKTINEDWDPVIVEVPNMAAEDDETVYSLLPGIAAQNDNTFVFIISRELIEGLSDMGLGFQVNNLEIKSVTLRDHVNGSSNENDGPDVPESAINTSVLTFDLDDSDPGNWSYGKEIKVRDFRPYFTGDIKVTLELEYVDDYQEKFEGVPVYGRFLDIHDKSGKSVISSAFNIAMATDDPNGGFYFGSQIAGYTDRNGQLWDFEFILTQEDVDRIDEYIYFRGQNCFVRSATFETYDPAEDAVGENALILDINYNTQFDEGFGGYTDSIPKDVLESFGGNVRITLDVEKVSSGSGDGIAHLYPLGSSTEGRFVSLYARNHGYSEDHVYIPEYEMTMQYPLGYCSLLPDRLQLVITTEQIQKLVDDGLWFDTTGFFVTKAYLEPADETAGTTVLTFDLDDSDPGSWSYGKLIKVNDFSPYFTGDIKVTLEIECVKDIVSDGEWAGVYSYSLNMQDRSGSNIIKSTFNMAIIEPPGGGFYFGPLGNKYAEPDGGLRTFEFVLTQEDVDRIDGYMRFKGENCFVRSATFETYDPNKYAALSANAERIELGVMWGDDYGEGSTGISKSKLESFGGDVRITLDVEGELFDAEDNSGVSHLWVRDMVDGRAIGVYIRNQGLAESHAQQDDRDGAPSYVLGDWTLMPKQIDLVITAEQIHELSSEDGLYFHILNGHVKAAYLEPA